MKLEISTNRLREVGKININLQGQLIKLEERVRESLETIQNMKKSSENSVNQWNLILADKEASISALQSELDTMEKTLQAMMGKQDSAEGQLTGCTQQHQSHLQPNEFAAENQVSKCLGCGEDVLGKRLDDISNQIEILTEIIVGDIESLVDQSKARSQSKVNRSRSGSKDLQTIRTEFSHYMSSERPHHHAAAVCSSRNSPSENTLHHATAVCTTFVEDPISGLADSLSEDISRHASEADNGDASSRGSSSSRETVLSIGRPYEASDGLDEGDTYRRGLGHPEWMAESAGGVSWRDRIAESAGDIAMMELGSDGDKEDDDDDEGLSEDDISFDPEMSGVTCIRLDRSMNNTITQITRQDGHLPPTVIFHRRVGGAANSIYTPELDLLISQLCEGQEEDEAGGRDWNRRPGERKTSAIAQIDRWRSSLLAGHPQGQDGNKSDDEQEMFAFESDSELLEEEDIDLEELDDDDDDDRTSDLDANSFVVAKSWERLAAPGLERFRAAAVSRSPSEAEQGWISASAGLERFREVATSPSATGKTWTCHMCSMRTTSGDFGQLGRESERSTTPDRVDIGSQTEQSDGQPMDPTERKKSERLERSLEVSELRLTGILEQLQEAQDKLKAADNKHHEQIMEINLLSRQIDTLQRRNSLTQMKTQKNSTSSFIIRDLQSQVQSLEEKNTKKDSLIRKLSEVLSSQPGSKSIVIEKIRDSTVKPSDRRIDFDIDTLCSFLENRSSPQVVGQRAR